MQSHNNLSGHHAPLMAGAAAAAAGPDLAEHPAYRNRNQDNPFVPSPPPPRRMAPNSRAGLTDATVAGDAPFLTDGNGRPISSKSNSMHKKSLEGNHDHHRAEELAVAAGTAGLGAAAMHHHEKQKDETRDHEADLLRGDSLAGGHERIRGGILRKPVASSHTPLSPVSPIEDDEYASQPLMHPTTISDHAFGANQMPISPVDSHSRDHSMGHEVAAGGAGAALGAAVAGRKSHESNRKSLDGNYNRTSGNVPDLPARTYIGDKVYGIPYQAAETGNAPNMIKGPNQPNSKGIQNWASRSSTAVNQPTLSPVSGEQSARPSELDRSSSHEPLLAAGAAGLAVGAGAGAIAAHRNRKSSRSPGRQRSRSFHSMVVGHRPESDYSTSSSGASGVQQPLSGREAHSMAAEPVASDDLPPTPPTRSRRNSAFGTAAPPAARGSHVGPEVAAEQERPDTQHSDLPPLPSDSFAAGPVFPVSVDRRGHRGSFGNGAGRPMQPQQPLQGQNGRQQWYQPQRASWAHPRHPPPPVPGPPPLFTGGPRSQTPPNIPSRSPRRARFSDLPYANTRDNSNSTTSSSSTGQRPASYDSHSAPRRPQLDTLPLSNSGGIVGDNGYPMMGPRARRNTSNFDDLVPVGERRPGDPERTSDGEGEGEGGSDESIRRISSAMPGGWSSRRNSNGNGPVAPRRPSPGGVRLSDLRREEEERSRRDHESMMREQGRRSMGGEWGGNGGYDGYDHYHGVGQAL